jgi:hypothetical protein
MPFNLNNTLSKNLFGQFDNLTLKLREKVELFGFSNA